MTTVAWDGRTLAADKRATVSGIRSTVTKVARGPNGNMVGLAGTLALFEDVIAWLCHGGERPESQDDKHEWCSVLEIDPQGRCWKHERSGRYLIEDRMAAIGTGGDFALAAMALGKTAAEAVQLASRFDTRTGDGVDALPFTPKAPKRSKRSTR